jgi:CDP-diacylglycerol---serine O-phosphatidyltransferase
MKKHIPNLLTLTNLFCGCLALLDILQNNVVSTACILMGVALVCDFLDGFVARALKVSGELGKQLDSLADCVTFGVVPGAMFYHILKEYVHLSQTWALIGFVITLFSALRLAKFNIDTRQSDSFIGVPTPANAMFVGALALNLESFNGDMLSVWVQIPWVAYSLIAMCCVWMVAEIPLIAFKFKSFGFKDNAIRYGIIIGSILALVLFKTSALPWIILGYVGVSIVSNFVENKR